MKKIVKFLKKEKGVKYLKGFKHLEFLLAVTSRLLMLREKRQMSRLSVCDAFDMNENTMQRLETEGKTSLQSLVMLLGGYLSTNVVDEKDWKEFVRGVFEETNAKDWAEYLDRPENASTKLKIHDTIDILCEQIGYDRKGS